MSYKHIKPLRPGTAQIVHAIKDDTVTLCGWAYMSGESFNGHQVPKGAATTEPLSCKSCGAHIRRQLIDDVILRVTTANIEQAYDSLVLLATPATTRRYR